LTQINELKKPCKGALAVDFKVWRALIGLRLGLRAIRHFLADDPRYLHANRPPHRAAFFLRGQEWIRR
jgi:hypothetical protein